MVHHHWTQGREEGEGGEGGEDEGVGWFRPLITVSSFLVELTLTQIFLAEGNNPPLSGLPISAKERKS